MIFHSVVPRGKNAVLRLRDGSLVPAIQDEPKLDVRPISASAFGVLNRQSRPNSDVRVFAASTADIEKALKVKQYSDPQEKLPRHYRRW